MMAVIDAYSVFERGGLRWFFCGLALAVHWLVVQCCVTVRVTGRAGGWKVGMKSSVSHYCSRTDDYVFQALADVEQRKTLSHFLSCKSSLLPFGCESLGTEGHDEAALSTSVWVEETVFTQGVLQLDCFHSYIPVTFVRVLSGFWQHKWVLKGSYQGKSSEIKVLCNMKSWYPTFFSLRNLLKLICKYSLNSVVPAWACLTVTVRE